MASVDEMIQLAEKVADELLRALMKSSRDAKQGISRVKASRGEWMRWMQIVDQSSLLEGIRYAQQLGNDDTLRPNIKIINREIGNVVQRYKERLSSLPIEEQKRVFGYVAWYLRIAAEEERAGYGQETSSRNPGHIARRGHRGH